MAIEPHLAMAYINNSDSEREELPDDASDQWSDTSSEVVEVDNDDIPHYFLEYNGHLFHSHVGSPYPLPVDGEEQKKANEQHDFLRSFHGRNYVGPVQDVLRPIAGEQRKALDLATGTGRWVLDMAQEFPHVKIYGLDIVPIATRTPPRNVQFEMHDIGQELRFRDETFDLIHSRFASMTVHNYEDLLYEAARVLRPQGMFLACEWGVASIREEGPANMIPITRRFFQILDECLACLGIHPVAPYLGNLLHRVGWFTGIHSIVHFVPVGEGHDDPEDKNIGREFLQVMLAYVESMKVVMEKAGKDMDDVEELVRGLTEEAYAARGMVLEYRTVYARKI